MCEKDRDSGICGVCDVCVCGVCGMCVCGMRVCVTCVWCVHRTEKKGL